MECSGFASLSWVWICNHCGAEYLMNNDEYETYFGDIAASTSIKSASNLDTALNAAIRAITSDDDDYRHKVMNKLARGSYKIPGNISKKIHDIIDSCHSMPSESNDFYSKEVEQLKGMMKGSVNASSDPDEDHSYRKIVNLYNNNGKLWNKSKYELFGNNIQNRLLNFFKNKGWREVYNEDDYSIELAFFKDGREIKFEGRITIEPRYLYISDAD